MIDFSTLKGLTIPEGVVKQITDESGAVLWKQAAGNTDAIITIDAISSQYAYVIVDGVTYATSTTLTVPIGTVITCVAKKGTAVGGKITLNYVDVAPASSTFPTQTYDYTVVSDATITLTTWDASSMGYVRDGHVVIMDANANVLPVVTLTRSGNQAGQASVEINGTTYTGATTIFVEAGTVITCMARWGRSASTVAPTGGNISVNDEIVAQRTSTDSTGTTTYTYTVKGSVKILLESYVVSTGSGSFAYGNVYITES